LGFLKPLLAEPGIKMAPNRLNIAENCLFMTMIMLGKLAEVL